MADQSKWPSLAVNLASRFGFGTFSAMGSDQQDTPAPRRQSSSPGVDLHDVSVLVVDDDDGAREIIAKFLTYYGATVQVAKDAEEAYAVLDKWHPDIILSDLAMPQEDGMAFMRNIRAKPAAAGGQIPAIAITAYSKDIHRSHVLRAGYQNCLSKPLDLNELLTVVTDLTHRAA
jgi:CheY-like chemotaxis protein